MQNLTKIKQKYDFSQMIELNFNNKLINNISNSSIRKFLTMYLSSLSINDCKIQSINKGIFNSLFNLKKLDLSRNEIESLENDTFSAEPFESNILELRFSDNKLREINYVQLNGLIKLEILYLDKNQIEEIEIGLFQNMPNLKQLYLHLNKIKLIQNEQLLAKQI